MKKKEFRNRLHTNIPDMPASFDDAMKKTLEGIVAEENAKKAGRGQRAYRRGPARRAVVFALVAVVLVGAVALATGLLTHNVFEMTMGDDPDNAASITQYNLVKVSFDECDVEVKEAAYDGVSLYIVYSIRDRNATEPLGDYDPDTDTYWLGEETFPAMERDNIGWWTDDIWIDGEDVAMPSMSGGENVGSSTPGEMLFYMMYRLDQEDVYLDGNNVEIALPIGKRQSLDSLVIDRSGDEPKTLKPDKGLVTFHLDCSIRNGITVENPDAETKLDNVTASVSEATYTPIQLYITLDTQVDADSLAAYIAENGEGWYDDQGNLIFPYSGMDVFGDWVTSLTLVDQDGVPVAADETASGFYGLQGYGDEHAWFTFPYLAEYPQEMYLAPLYGDTADMTQAVRVK